MYFDFDFFDFRVIFILFLAPTVLEDIFRYLAKGMRSIFFDISIELLWNILEFVPNASEGLNILFMFNYFIRFTYYCPNTQK